MFVQVTKRVSTMTLTLTFEEMVQLRALLKRANDAATPRGPDNYGQCSKGRVGNPSFLRNLHAVLAEATKVVVEPETLGDRLPEPSATRVIYADDNGACKHGWMPGACPHGCAKQI